MRKKQRMPSEASAFIHKQALEKLTPLELQNIFKKVDHEIAILDKNERIVFLNNNFCNLLKCKNLEQQPCLGKKITNFFPKDFISVYLKQIKPLLKGKQSWRGEIDFINTEKKIIRTSCEIVPIKSSKKDTIYYVYWVSPLPKNIISFCQSLDESTDFFRSLFQMSPDPIYLIDEEGNILLGNKKLSAITGYPAKKLAEKTIYDIEQTISSKKQLTSLINNISKKGHGSFPGKLIDKNKDLHPVEVSLRRISICGQPSILITSHDISLRKKYQQEAQYNIKLRNLITKVTNRFSLVSVNSFDNAANKALGDLGKFAEVDRCYLFKLKDNELFFTDNHGWRPRKKVDISELFFANTHEWCAEGITSEIEHLRHIPFAPYLWVFRYFQEHSVFALDRVEDLPDNYAIARNEFMREGIKSILIVPLRRGKYYFGTIGFDAVYHHVSWDAATIQLLSDFSNFIAQALDRRETLLLEEQKEQFEFTLTKKILNATVEELAFFIKNVPSSIAIFDLNLRYVAVSDRWLEDFRVKKKNIIGKSHLEIFKTDASKWKKIFKRCLKGEMISSEKDYFNGPDGKGDWIKWKAYPKKDHDNKICGIVILLEVITERVKNEEKIIHIMNHDILTDIPNRQYFHETLEKTLSDKKRKQYTLIITSIENFETINNYYNVFVGDKFIQEISKRLQNCITKSTFFARLDAGQFAFILQGGNEPQIVRFVKKINSCVSEPFHIQNYYIRTSLSFGIRVFKPNGLSYEKLIKDAEIALYQARLSSINKIAYFNSTLEEKYLRRLLLENDLQRAIDESQFYTVYQPFFSLQAKKVVGAEVLLRWRHPKLKEVSPLEFIPLAEKTGKIIPIGYQVLIEVFENIKQLLKIIEKQPTFIFSINLSPDQLIDKEFIKNLKKMIDKYKIPIHLLQFEITETRLLQNTNEVISALKQIKKLGCKIAIDDFGTGHSSLERLRELPASSLKIDKCFIDNIDTNEKSTSLVKHILMLARELRMTTVGEGIENKSQEHMLQFLGCDIGQGFYYSKPIPIKKFAAKYLK
ncbi:MAG: EAL domain-containing protein [Gammaproteobacteria bacterium]